MSLGHGKFSEKNPTYVWFSDDPRRVVVQISSDFAIGRANARLVHYQPGQQVEEPAVVPGMAPAPESRTTETPPAR